MTIGDVITKMRLQKNVSLQEMADAIQITKEYLWMIEKDKKMPSAKVFKNISDYFGLPVSAILFQVLKSSDFSDKKSQALFDKAKPIIDQLISILTKTK